jgi:hypothetical protein
MGAWCHVRELVCSFEVGPKAVLLVLRLGLRLTLGQRFESPKAINGLAQHSRLVAGGHSFETGANDDTEIHDKRAPHEPVEQVKTCPNHEP